MQTERPRSPRRFALLIAAVGLGLLLGFWWQRRGPDGGSGASSPKRSTLAVPATGPRADRAAGTTVGTTRLAAVESRTVVPGFGLGDAPGATAASTEVDNQPRITLADGLNAPGGTQEGDLRIVQTVLEAWRSNFPHEGNPVGENVEITAALLGKNRLHLALISPDNPAVNDRGELCDRWGTPLLFHQLSGETMELFSAGPDRKFGTADDISLPPR